MSDDFDVYGDTDPNNVPDGGAGQDTTAGDGLPGFPMHGYPGWRAGAFAGSDNVLGLVQPPPAPADQHPRIDWGFVHKQENVAGPGLSLQVPNRKNVVIGHSGATLGYGVDLGGRTIAGLKALGLSQPVIDALAPYLPYQGQPALDYVKAHPLTLQPSDVQAIDAAVENQNAQALADKFDAASEVGAFRNLPANAQTAIADLYFQYGTGNPAGAAPNFWRQITQGDWQGAHDNLKDFGDAYAPRRGLEADRLAQDISAGVLPVPKR